MAKTSAAVIAQRVEDIFGLVIDGQPLRVIRRYVSENCSWHVNDRTLERYMSRARYLAIERSEEICEHARAVHVNRLERLYTLSLNKSDAKTALAVEQEIARLHGMNAPTRQELTGADGAPLIPASDVELSERFKQLVRDQSKRLKSGK